MAGNRAKVKSFIFHETSPENVGDTNAQRLVTLDAIIFDRWRTPVARGIVWRNSKQPCDVLVKPGGNGTVQGSIRGSGEWWETRVGVAKVMPEKQTNGVLNVPVAQYGALTVTNVVFNVRNHVASAN